MQTFLKLFTYTISIIIISFNSGAAYSLDDKNTIQDANQYLISGQWNKAYLAYNYIINNKINEQNFDIDLAIAYAKLSELEQIRGNFAKAIYYLQNSIYIKQKLQGSSQTINQINNLSNLFLKINQPNKAWELKNKIVYFTKNQLSINNSSRIDLLNLTELKKFANNTMANDKYKNDFLEWANYLNQIGDLAKSSNQAALAKECYNLGLMLRIKATSGNHLAVAQSLDKLGNLSIETNQFKQAKIYYQESYKISLNILGANKIDTINRAICLAKSLKVNNEFSNCQKLLDKQLLIATGSFGKNSINLTNIQFELALLNQHINPAISKNLLSQAIEILEKNYGPANATLIPYLDLYAQILNKNNEIDKASKLIARSKAIQG